MKKLFFTHSYFLRYDPKQWRTGQPYAPLGTLYAAAHMREHGYEVTVFDTMFSQKPEEIIPELEFVKPDFFLLYDDGFNYLTKMCLTNMREAAFRMIDMAKQQGSKVIVSSSDSTDHYEQYLDAGADFVLLGEAEMTLLELMNMMQQNREDFFSIPGLAFRKQGAMVKTSRRNVIRNLDELPLPAWDLIDLEPYRQMWMKSSGYFSMNMATTRGCPFKCNWCAKPIYGNRYHSRSPANVVRELLLLREKYHFDHIWFCDDIFGLKPGWVKEFAGLVEEQQLHFKFKIQARADLLVEEDTVRDLASAGCRNVWMGAESGSQKILDAMDKGITIDQIRKATSLLKQHSISPSFFIQFGYTGEDKEDIRKTIHMINELLPHEIGISVSYPLPGTVFYDRVKTGMKTKSNWTDSDDLSLMFANTYPSDFYKKLHRYLHHHFHRIKATEKWKTASSSSAKLDLLHFRNALRIPYYFIKEMASKPSLTI